jgi:hypothetical protein
MCIKVQKPGKSNNHPGIVAIEFVYPNTSEIPLRGSLDERLKLAESVGCSFIEVPADLIKNVTESNVTGQNLCTFLTKQSIAALYKKSGQTQKNIKYILHTEPSVPRRDEFGLCVQTPIKWYDSEWVTSYIQMLVDISDFFNIPASKIEIHPGDRRNSFTNIVESIRKIQEEYDNAFAIFPEVLLENRTDQIISNGDDIAKFWTYITKNDPELKKSFGMVLDVQQLKTVTKKKFNLSLEQIPEESLKGFHIHTLHKPPTIADTIPWELVFDKIIKIQHDLIINPEIHHNNRVLEVIQFCKQRIEQSST